MKWIGRMSLALAALPLVASCQTTQYQAALNEREAENRALREERTALKNQMRDLQYQNESLETALAEANARLVAEPAPVAAAPAQQFPQLDELGIDYVNTFTRVGERIAR